MNFDEFEKLIGNKPATIKASVDEKEHMKIEINGRGIEVMTLSIAITKRVIECSKIPVNDYCEIIKKACLDEKQRKQEVEKMLKKILDELVK